MNFKKGMPWIIAGVLITASIFAWLFYGSEIAKPVEVTNNEMKVNMKVLNTNIQQDDNGKKIWDFNVKEAEYIGDKIVVTGIKGKIYLKDGEIIDVDSGGGTLYGATNTIELSNGVTAVTKTGRKLVSEKIYWDRNTNVITAEGAVKILSEDVLATGDKAITDGNIEKVKLVGNAMVEQGGNYEGRI